MQMEKAPAAPGRDGIVDWKESPDSPSEDAETVPAEAAARPTRSNQRDLRNHGEPQPDRIEQLRRLIETGKRYTSPAQKGQSTDGRPGDSPHAAATPARSMELSASMPGLEARSDDAGVDHEPVPVQRLQPPLPHAGATRTPTATEELHMLRVELAQMIRSGLNRTQEAAFQEVRVRYRGAHLGEVDITLREGSDALSVVVRSESDRGMLQDPHQRDQLRRMLQTMGYRNVSLDFGRREQGRENPRQHHPTGHASGVDPVRLPSEPESEN
jgi:hypothetical protein